MSAFLGINKHAALVTGAHIHLTGGDTLDGLRGVPRLTGAAMQPDAFA